MFSKLDSFYSYWESCTCNSFFNGMKAELVSESVLYREISLVANQM